MRDKNIFIMFIITFLTFFDMCAQNFVASGGEFYSGPMGFDFQSSTMWSTDRSSSPGYFSWDNSSGNAYTGADDTHHVNGYVKKYGKVAFTFPIGTGSDYRTISIGDNAAGLATDAYAAAWITGDPNSTPDPTNADSLHYTTAVSGGIVDVSLVGQWDWQVISGTGEGLAITVSMPGITATGAFMHPANLRLVGWNGASWVNLGDEGATSSVENSVLKGIMVQDIEAIAIGTVCNSGSNYPIIK